MDCFSTGKSFERRYMDRRKTTGIRAGITSNRIIYFRTALPARVRVRIIISFPRKSSGSWLFNTYIPCFCQYRIFRTEYTDVPDLSDSSSRVIDNEQTLVAVVAADLRPCQANGATGLSTAVEVAEKRAGAGKFIKNARTQEKIPHIGINTGRRILAGTGIMDQKRKSPNSSLMEWPRPRFSQHFPH